MKIVNKTVWTTLLMMVCGQAFALSSDNKPEYQREYESYLRDLEVIEQTGLAPANPSLEADLAKMNSNDRIRLTSRFSSTPLLFAQVNLSDNVPNAEVLNKVEVIRVPKEFQDIYADIYLQQLEELEGSLTKEEQETLNRLRGGNDIDNVGHENPFKNVEIGSTTKVSGETNVKEDAMVNAYFSSNRAFVSGSPIALYQKESQSTYSPSVSSSTSTSSTSVPQYNNGSGSLKSTTKRKLSSSSRRSSGHSSSGNLPSLRRGMFLD